MYKYATPCSKSELRHIFSSRFRREQQTWYCFFLFQRTYEILGMVAKHLFIRLWLQVNLNIFHSQMNGYNLLNYSKLFSDDVNRVNTLLNSGGLATIVDDLDWTPMHYAAANGNVEHSFSLIMISVNTENRMRLAASLCRTNFQYFCYICRTIWWILKK